MARGKDVLSAIDTSASLRHKSSLHQWMFENHDAFQARLDERVADWTVLAKLFEDGGLTNRYGLPPKAETARKAWQTVRKEVAKMRAKPTYQAPERHPAAQPLTPSPSAPRSSGDDDIRALLSGHGAPTPKPLLK